MGGAGGAAAQGILGIWGNALGQEAKAEDAAFQEEQARQNSVRADIAAADAEKRGAEEAAQIQSKGTQTIATGRVATAASGIELGSPTAQRVAATTRAYATLDSLTAKSNAAREAWGYRQKAKEYKDISSQYAAKKKSALEPMNLLFGG